MVLRHHSTPEHQAQWVSQMIAQAGTYGAVTQLSQRAGVCRQTLYNWAQRGRAALAHLFQRPERSPATPQQRDRLILSLLVEGHASYRGIQACLRCLGQAVSLGTIAHVVQAAQQRALDWLAQHAPTSRRSIALDEIFGKQRGVAYLSIVDTDSWAVWALGGPLAADSESWTLLLWLAQESGLHWHRTVTDGGAAMAHALRTVDPTGEPQRDIWHLLHECGVVQARLERAVTRLTAQAPTVARQAARIAAGGRARGRRAQADEQVHAQHLRQAQQTAADLRYLSSELRHLLAVVVLRAERVLPHAERLGEIETVLALLAEVAAAAPSRSQPDLRGLHQHLSRALPGMVSFSAGLEGVQQQGQAVLGAAALGLLGWAWQRRAQLGASREEVLDGLPVAWRGPARLVWHAWEGVARASSAVENWHSILRPHLAVHRRLSPGLLALLAVWHNHRVFARGEHAGQSPLELSGITDAPHDWLIALGYPAVEAPPPSSPPRDAVGLLPWAA